jgi:hypothetical protein
MIEWPGAACPERSLHREAPRVPLAPGHAHPRLTDADQVRIAQRIYFRFFSHYFPFHSCLKDLATLRNPSSSYTFLNYLHSQNRLITFINRGTTIPSRREYADYLTWAATEVQKKGVNVAFSEEVVSVSKIDDDQDSPYVIEVISRRLATGEIVKRRTSEHRSGAYDIRPLSIPSTHPLTD